MKALGWLLALSLLAVLLAAVLRYSPGYVLIVVPPYQMELSVGITLAGLALLFGLGYLLLRAGSRLAALPGDVRAWRAQGRRERGMSALAAAMRAWLAGRSGRALEHAQQAYAEGAAPAESAMIAAYAAHELRRFDERDQRLADAQRHDGDDPTARLMAQARWLGEDGKPEQALAVLATLPAQHTAALRLELTLRQRLSDWDAASVLIDQLADRGALPTAEREMLARHVASEGLRQRATDAGSALEAWHKLPARLRADRGVALTAARLLGGFGESASARPIIEQVLDERWDSTLALQYSAVASDAPAEDITARIARCEHWLTLHPNDAMLLLGLGRLCLRESLWGKAQSCLEASLSVEPTYSAHLALATLHAELGHQETAARHRDQALELALRALDTATGGRRRVAL